MNFGEGAVRLAGRCGVLLGWTPETFWTATPAELAALVNALVPEAADPPDGAMMARLKEQFPDG